MRTRKSKCKPGFVDWSMFGWCFRLPNGSAARTKGSHHPRYFKTPQEVWLWVNKQKVVIGGGLHGEPLEYVRCEVLA